MPWKQRNITHQKYARNLLYEAANLLHKIKIIFKNKLQTHTQIKKVIILTMYNTRRERKTTIICINKNNKQKIKSFTLSLFESEPMPDIVQND